jgi:seryl-tRNA synthetase
LLDLGEIRGDPERFRRGIERKGLSNAVATLDWIVALSAYQKSLVAITEAMRAANNKSNALIGKIRHAPPDQIEPQILELKQHFDLTEGLMRDYDRQVVDTAVAAAGPGAAEAFVQWKRESAADLIRALEAQKAKLDSLRMSYRAQKSAGRATLTIDGPAEPTAIRHRRIETAITIQLDRSLSESLISGMRSLVDGFVADLARRLPNPPDDDVPDGKSSEDNREISRRGTPPSFPFAPKAHWDLGAALGILDAEAGGAMSGSGFPVLKGDGARLERALGQFLLDLAGRHGYREVSVPLLLRQEVMDGVTMASKFRDDMYLSEKDGLYLLPTAEHPLTNLHRESILDAAALPLRYTALTPCFRREAGAAGKDTRGLLRVHQFWKVEMMSFTTPEQSRDEHERMLGNAKAALEALGIPYRVVLVCTGDMSVANRRQYDLEAWAAGVGKWLEVSSVSNFGDWQARRCGTRCRSGKEKPRVAHTLNGSALGMPRTLVAILENGQRADGSVAIPEVLRPYMGGRESIAAPGAGA